MELPELYVLASAVELDVCQINVERYRCTTMYKKGSPWLETGLLDASVSTSIPVAIQHPRGWTMQLAFSERGLVVMLHSLLAQEVKLTGDDTANAVAVLVAQLRQCQEETDILAN